MAIDTSIDSFIGKLSGVELAMPNRYWVNFILPRGAGGVSVFGVNSKSRTSEIHKHNLKDNLSIMCNQMQFPGRSLMTVESRHMGTPFKLPYAAVYDDVSFTFTASKDHQERKFFEIWQETVVNIRVNSMNFYREYVAPITLQQLDKEGNVTYEVELIDAYPIAIDSVNSSYATRDDIQNVTVTLAYRFWRNTDI